MEARDLLTVARFPSWLLGRGGQLLGFLSEREVIPGVDQEQKPDPRPSPKILVGSHSFADFALLCGSG